MQQNDKKNRLFGELLETQGEVSTQDIRKALTVQKRAKRRLGEVLVEEGIITEEQVQNALQMQKKNKRRLGDILVEMGATTEDAIARTLHLQLGLPIIDLRGISIPSNIITLVSGDILRKHRVLPIGLSPNDPGTLILAMSDPLDMRAQDDIAIITNLRIEPKIATVSAINRVLDKYFGAEEAMTAADRYTREREQQQVQTTAVQAEEDKKDINSAPIVQLVRSIIAQAVRQRASDIHIEALEKQVRIRYRIDGVLSKKMTYDSTILSALVTRIKIIAGMDISEKRKPQDGRITFVVDLIEYDIRVSILPTSYGEKVVMRLAATNGFTKKIADLGMRKEEMQCFEHILHNPNGIILVTGPTGSGKSTTLYTAISALNREDLNIVTVEDPVEANIPGVNQVQVNPKADLTFASALRSILRQDPDIIMVGEIRDYETAAIAVQASITGHLVVSTLHTNSAAATITRLLDMGVESFLIADSVVGVIAQRLVRKLCPHCRKARSANDMEKKMLGIDDSQHEVTIYDRVGCPMCGGVGFYGRIGVYEIMEITPELRRAIAQKATTEQIKKLALQRGMHTLHQSAVAYVLEGVTTISEMTKVSFEG